MDAEERAREVVRTVFHEGRPDFQDLIAAFKDCAREAREEERAACAALLREKAVSVRLYARVLSRASIELAEETYEEAAGAIEAREEENQGEPPTTEGEQP